MTFSLAWTGGTLKGLSETFEEYAALNGRDKVELRKKQSKELAENLFKATPAASANAIRSKVRSLGWRVKRPGWDKRFSTRKIHNAMKPLQGHYVRARILGSYRMKREKWESKTEKQKYKKDSKGQLRQFQDAVIAIRISRIYALRAGWIPALQELGSKLNVAKPRRKNRGYASVSVGGTNWSVTICNQMPGIATVNATHDILGKAIQMTILNMNEYIQRKKLERAGIWVKRKQTKDRTVITVSNRN